MRIRRTSLEPSPRTALSHNSCYVTARLQSLKTLPQALMWPNACANYAEVRPGFLSLETVTTELCECFIPEERMSKIAMSEPALEFEAIFNDHAWFIYRTAYSITGSQADAEDVVQAIFIQLLLRFPPDLRRNPRAYLYRAAVNSSLNIIRRRRNEILMNRTECFGRPVSTNTGDLETEVRQLYEAISELKPEAAEIVIMRYVHNKSDAEIAQVLGKSRGAIALKLFRARARLKRLLLAKFGDQR